MVVFLKILGLYTFFSPAIIPPWEMFQFLALSVLEE